MAEEAFKYFGGAFRTNRFLDSTEAKFGKGEK